MGDDDGEGEERLPRCDGVMIVDRSKGKGVAKWPERKKECRSEEE